MKSNIGHLWIMAAGVTSIILSNPLRKPSILDRLEAIPDKFMTGNTATFTGIPVIRPDENGVRFIPMRFGVSSSPIRYVFHKSVWEPVPHYANHISSSTMIF